MVKIVQESQKDEKIQEVQHEVAIVLDPFWSIKWAGLPSSMEHLEVSPTPISLEVREEVGQ